MVTLCIAACEGTYSLRGRNVYNLALLVERHDMCHGLEIAYITRTDSLLSVDIQLAEID